MDWLNYHHLLYFWAVAKEGSIFEVEKNVAGKAPVDDIQMDDLTINKKKVNNVQNSKKSFILVISDFYYENSAIILKDELVKKTQNNNKPNQA